MRLLLATRKRVVQVIYTHLTHFFILAAFAERVNLRDFNDYSRKQNHTFAQRTPICRHISLRDEGEFFAIYKIMANQISG